MITEKVCGPFFYLRVEDVWIAGAFDHSLIGGIGGKIRFLFQKVYGY